MAEILPLGVEEEFQTVYASNLALAPHGFSTLMRRATPRIEERMKPEFLQCVVECITPVCASVEEVRRETMTLRATAMRLARRGRLAVLSSGTHPFSRWDEQQMWEGRRYAVLRETLEDVARSILIYGLHVHAQIEDEARRIAAMNQARTYLPYILALSVNSPFWQGRLTGYQSFRTIVWAPFPFSGIPDPFPTLDDYREFVELMRRLGALGRVRLPNGEEMDDIRRIWWDIRAHSTLPTLEFRIADMPATHADMIALVAFIQALVGTILTRLESGDPLPVLPTPVIAENRWRAARFGLRGTMIDYPRQREAPTVELIGEALDLLRDAADALGTSEQMAYLRRMLEPEYQTGAERQIAAYDKRQSLLDVARALAEQTRQGIDPRAAMPLRRPWPFGRRERRPVPTPAGVPTG
jgi:glutamate---cysteine ligase / carboxylate-amine ligase